MTRPSELLADRALVGLSDEEIAELRELGAADDDTFELAAAAVDLATLSVEAMPAGMAERIADRAMAARQPRIPTTIAGWSMPGMPIAAPAPPVPAPVVPIASARKRSVVPWIISGMAVAAAAIVLLVVRPSGEPARLDPTADRSELLATGASKISWIATKEAPGTSGDVVWSESAQRGYMRFVGLAPNDPKKTQYQLWIFDKTRDKAFPVDGGVFDVSSTGEIIVPITAKLHVDDATLFAVTVEKPGGVVVSKREHIVVTTARS